MVSILFLILFILLIIVGGKRGVKTFVTFFLSLLLITIYLIFMNLGFDSIKLSIIICILSSIVSLFILNGYNLKTKSSFISILIVLFLIFFLVYLIGRFSNIQGFSENQMESISLYSHSINYDMVNVIIGVYLISIIGTVVDTSISISSAMNEVYENNKKTNITDLFKSGLNIGSDILSTTINTLFFALIGGFLGFFMWYHTMIIEQMINHKVFAQDIIQLLISFIASILIIPITSYITAITLVKKRD